MTSIRLENISKSYGETTVLSQLNLSIDSGSLVSILGPSGCGKTTLLRILAGFVRPDEGRVWFGDTDITSMRPQHRKVSMVFQEYVLFPHLTVFENIAFGLRQQKLESAAIHRRVQELVHLLQLGGLEDRLPAQLSGGQRQRVGLGRALAIDPQVLLLDEPMGALDAALRDTMRTEIKEIQQSFGMTSILVTHDREEALAIADRLAVMQDGKILQYGQPRLIYDRPATPFVARSVGDINLLTAKLLPSPPDGLKLQVPGLQLLEYSGWAEQRIEAAEGSGPFEKKSIFRHDSEVDVLLGIRPEEVQLSSIPAAEAGLRMDGIIKRIDYLGRAQRLNVRLPSGVEMVIDTSSDTLHRTDETITAWVPSSSIRVWCDGQLLT